jgi:hypothetical protein
MNYDVPSKKVPEIVIERPFTSVAKEDAANNDPLHKPAHDSDNFGGIFVSTGGTANASPASPSAPPEEYIYFIPESGPLPEVEMEKQHVASNMEQAV